MAEQLTVEFGIVKTYPETVIQYKGDAETGVIIEIEVIGSSASSIRINNVTRSEYIIIDHTKLAAIVGSDLEQYDLLTINTNRGSKSAKLLRGGVSYDVLHAIDLSSKWIYLQTGPNKMTYSATPSVDQLRISIKCPVKVLGV